MNEKKKTKDLAKGAALYGVGTFGTKILSFLIVPLYTYYISPEDMGVYDILISTTNLLSPIITLQISDAAYKSLMREAEKDRDLYIRATVQVVIFNCLIASLLIFIVDKFFTIPYCGYFVAVLITTRAQASIHKLLRGLKNQKLYVISGLVHSVIFLSLNVIQICVFKRGIVSFFVSSVVSNLGAIVCMFLLEKRLRVNFVLMPNVNLIKKLLAYSAPLVPNYLNWWVINASDRYIVAFFLGSTSNGILAVAHKFPSLLHTIFGLFTSSWTDAAVAESESNIGEYYTKVFRQYSRFGLSLLWVLIPFTKIFIMFIMDVRYINACNYVPFYYLGMVFQAFSSFYGVGYLRGGNTGKAFSTSIYGAVINAITNLLLINFVGIHAASISTFVGFLVVWITRERQNRAELGIVVNWFEIVGLTLLSIIVSLISIGGNVGQNLILLAVGSTFFLILNRKMQVAVMNEIIQKLNKKKSFNK